MAQKIETLPLLKRAQVRGITELLKKEEKFNWILFDGQWVYAHNLYIILGFDIERKAKTEERYGYLASDVKPLGEVRKIPIGELKKWWALEERELTYGDLCRFEALAESKEKLQKFPGLHSAAQQLEIAKNLINSDKEPLDSLVIDPKKIISILRLIDDTPTLEFGKYQRTHLLSLKAPPWVGIIAGCVPTHNEAKK